MRDRQVIERRHDVAEESHTSGGSVSLPSHCAPSIFKAGPEGPPPPTRAGTLSAHTA